MEGIIVPPKPWIGVQDCLNFVVDAAALVSVHKIFIDHYDPLTPLLEPLVVGHSLAPASISVPLEAKPVTSAATLHEQTREGVGSRWLLGNPPQDP